MEIPGREGWKIYTNEDNTETHLELFMTLSNQADFMVVMEYNSNDKPTNFDIDFITTQGMRNDKIDELINDE